MHNLISLILQKRECFTESSFHEKLVWCHLIAIESWNESTKIQLMEQKKPTDS